MSNLRSVFSHPYICLGAVAFAGTAVACLIVRYRLNEHFAALETSITSELHELRRKVAELQATVDKMGHSSASLMKPPSQRGPGGYETGDDEYITADSSDSDSERGGPRNGGVRTKRNEGDPSIERVVSIEERKFYKEIDALLDGDATSQDQAHRTLLANNAKYNSSCGYWWRLAKSTHIESNNVAKDNKKTTVFAAFGCAEKALEICENSGNAHKWYAITLGSKGDFLPMSEKIQNGFTFKEHIDKAVSINPRDATLYHLLGRFCYEVSNLSWVERKVAATLFSAPPSATPKDAVTNFQNCERLGKPFKENRLFLAKSYLAMNDKKKAAYWLNAASNLPISSNSDRKAQDEIGALLPKYRSYLN